MHDNILYYILKRLKFTIVRCSRDPERPFQKQIAEAEGAP